MVNAPSSSAPQIGLTVPDSPNPGSVCEIKAYRYRHRKDGAPSVDEIRDAFDASSTELRPEVDASYALVVKRHFDQKHKLTKTELRINSPAILSTFRDIIGSYPTVPSDFSSPFDLVSPYQMLFHHWEHLEAHLDQTEDYERRLHLKLLFDFMTREIGADREEVLSMVRNRSITFHTAWAIFRPGDLVYMEFMEKPWLLRIHRTAYEESSSYGPYMTVYARYCDANRDIIGQAATSVKILQKTSFASGHPAIISSLPIYPREFHHRGEDDLEMELAARGRKFVTCRGTLTQEYEGLAEYLNVYPEEKWVPFVESGRIVLDRKTFEDEHYSHRVNISAQSHPDLTLCPPYVMGFSLDRKDWCRYAVDGLRDVAWKDDAWASLILEEQEKKVLQALVTSHRYPKNPRNQPEQKGKGLVFLLHGTPGSGKTMSAETSAEMSRKALLSASLGDLDRNNVPWLFERRLKKLLQYAALWQAIVLLDEADIFLEARQTGSDVGSRNALVAVFLRELEYFSGIVFLTTNRLTTFDAAMKSRVHLSLRFVPPNSDKRRRLWIQQLASIPVGETSMGDTAAIMSAADNLKEHDLNGREICNALNTARTLARFEGNALEVRHIESVVEVGRKFDTHLRQESARLTKAATYGGSNEPAYRLVKRDSILSQGAGADEED